VSKNTKQAIIASDTALQKGLDSKYSTATWTVAGQPYTTAQVDALLQKRIADNEASDTAHATWLGSCASAKATMQQTNPVIRAVQSRIRGEVGNDAGALAVFGMKPTKTGKKSAQVKAQAVVKSAATRKKNNTMGAAQRKAADKAAEQAPVQEPAGTPAAQHAPAEPAPAGQAPSKQ
jgi:hypothetical protein